MVSAHHAGFALAFCQSTGCTIESVYLFHGLVYQSDACVFTQLLKHGSACSIFHTEALFRALRVQLVQLELSR